MAKKPSTLSNKSALVATVAFMTTALIVVLSDLFDVPGLLGSVANASGPWLRHAIDAGLILIAGAVCVGLMSKLERARIQTEERYQTLVEQANDGIYIVQQDRIVYSSPRMTEIAGYSPEELRGRSYVDFVAPSSLGAVTGYRAREGSGQLPPDSFELEVQAKDGHAIPVQVTTRPIDFHGSPAVMAVLRDITERKKAEDSLRFSDAAFKSIHESVYSMDKDFVVTHWNAICEKMFGVLANDAIGKYIGDVVTMVERYPGQNKERLEVLLERGYNQEEQLYRTPRGDIWVDIRVQAIESNGRRQGWVTLAADITDRKRAEEAILFKNALLEAEAETAVEGILATDTEGRIVLSNRHFREMWRITGDTLQGTADRAVLSCVGALAQDPEGFTTKLRRLERSVDQKGQDVVELKDGRVIELYSGPLTDANGANRGRIWYFRDMTEPVRLRERLERAAEEWRSTFDSITDLISIHNKENRLLRVNRAFASKHGTTPKELLGQTCHQVSHGSSCPPDDCPVLQTLRTGKPAVVEVFNASTGSWVQESTSPIFGEDGIVTGTVNIIKDVTEFKEMEQRLIMTDRLASIGELVSGIAHELNNPLTGVIGFSQLVMDKDVSDDVREDLSIVSSEAQRAARIVKNLLTFARKHAAVKQPSQVNAILEDVLRLRAYEQKVNNIEVVKNLSPDLPEIMADYFQLQQVFLNIVINAEFFMIETHKQGTLTISTERTDGFIRVSFADNGPGIAPENLSRIFDPFFTTKEVGKGTGLGLSICHGIVAEHRGSLYAKSELGKGATFVVELPTED